MFGGESQWEMYRNYPGTYSECSCTCLCLFLHSQFFGYALVSMLCGFREEKIFLHDSAIIIINVENNNNMYCNSRHVLTMLYVLGTLLNSTLSYD